jgi:hypothetical protein
MKKENFALKFVAGSEAITAADVKAAKETKDCVVRAFMNAAQVSYDEAHAFVATQFDREDKKGTYSTAYTLNKMALAKTPALGRKVVSLGSFGPRPMTPIEAVEAKVLLNTEYPKGGGTFASFTVGKFLAQAPKKGSFFIIVAGHALAIRDGKIYDNVNYRDNLFIQKGRDQRRCQAIFQLK